MTYVDSRLGSVTVVRRSTIRPLRSMSVLNLSISETRARQQSVLYKLLLETVFAAQTEHQTFKQD